jgi:hypothetical protein
MTSLNQLLDGYMPPPVPQDLASRAVVSSVAHPQRNGGRFAVWRRGQRRGGWKRSIFAGSAALGLVFASAVAAEIVSGGRIEIPVVHQVVEAIPVLRPAPPHIVEKKQLAMRKARHVAPALASDAAQPAVIANQPRPAQQRLMERFAAMEQRVVERRAAGLPTPRADRIERQANRIVERRQARGLPAPSIEQVEMRLAMREALKARLLRQIPDDPAAVSDVQLRQFRRLLPPLKRARFLALNPDIQRQMMVRFAERIRTRRVQRRDKQVQTSQQPSQGSPPPR